MRRKPLANLVQEFVVEKFESSGMSMIKFCNTYNLSITTLDKFLKQTEIKLYSTIVDRILTNLEIDLATLAEKYGEYLDE